ncbi:hypothetical protein AB205_0068460, partial [Aquarana catesbeiana]
FSEQNKFHTTVFVKVQNLSNWPEHCNGWVISLYQLYVLFVVSVLIYISSIFYNISYYLLPLMTRFCGSQHPPQMRSASNVVTVIMRSDSSVELDGFSLRFSTMQSTSGIHLVGGKNSLEGIVEVDYQGFRGNICPKHWSNKDAKVVCRQLGFQGPAIATRIFGEDTVLSAISSVNCNGSEAVLENCNMKNSGTCDTKERAGVICQ